MKKILITGANGFIGMRIAKELSKNHSIDVYCRKLKKDDPDFVIDNNLKKNIISTPFKEINYDYVINCIACTETHSTKWKDLYDANCQTTISLVKNLKFKNFIQFSSFSIFSKNSISQGLADPQNFYGLSKLVSEKFLEINSNQNNNHIVLRMPIVIGRTKKQDDLISYLFKSLINNETIDLFNEGKYQRNIIHVDDIANYVDKLITKDDIKKNYSVFNLNSSSTMSIYEICVYMKNKLNSKSKIKFSDSTNINDFDSLILEDSQKKLNYRFKSCNEALDRFILESKAI